MRRPNAPPDDPDPEFATSDSVQTDNFYLHLSDRGNPFWEVEGILVGSERAYVIPTIQMIQRQATEWLEFIAKEVNEEKFEPSNLRLFWDDLQLTVGEFDHVSIARKLGQIKKDCEEILEILETQPHLHNWKYEGF